MAKDLSLQTGIDNSDANYLNGKIVDNQTLIGEGINQDIVQFFQKLMHDSLLVVNDDFDNENNGYQFISALRLYIDKRIQVKKGYSKFLDIGNWNMNSSGTGITSISVPHGLSDHEKIRNISVIIRNDAGTKVYPLAMEDGVGISEINATNVDLTASTGKYFDTANFSATSYNRGFVKIDYVA